MKCVKDKTDGKVQRVADEVAHSMVARYPERYGYCPKSEWKALRPKKVAETPKPEAQTVKTEKVVKVRRASPKRADKENANVRRTKKQGR